ncbi:CRISPR-associated endonuclease Cas6 [Neolewinella lacunae]|uniref:DNA repair protein n=1 Tax=Neolewinella lacunae TaxID=1517758 RepID=A0A923PIC6_9BACT|nr:CRISPR-associated endonuclease Cas6 [Neolewinella lacunae]MBC6994622.1 DNA repair protein [Neolewinella lacunae]MDN3634494.1 CRISPR-associated endonuclease Cas6 [Neolewinella lacunae]
MTTLVDLTTLTFSGLHLRAADAGKLRGYFAAAFGDRSILFHNHTEEDGFRYAYSNIQYKVLGGVPTVVGVAEGARLVLLAFADVEELNLDGQRVRVDDKELRADRIEAGVIDELREYRLATPLFMFNQDNYALFRTLPDAEGAAFLTKLLRSHLVTALRGIGCTVTPERPIMVLPRLEKRLVNVKNQPMQMYVGTFTANVALPPAIGIGKSISKGFGTVVPA